PRRKYARISMNCGNATSTARPKNALGNVMDMSDKIVAEGVDELERDRERLKAESRAVGAALGKQSVSSIGQKLKLMFGGAAAASAILGALALGALVTGVGATSGLLVAMVLVALATTLLSVM